MNYKFYCTAITLIATSLFSNAAAEKPAQHVCNLDLVPSNIRSTPLKHGSASVSAISEKTRHSSHHMVPSAPEPGKEMTNASIKKRHAVPEDKTEKLDSVVRINLAGIPVSKQTFNFTEEGNPLECVSFVPAGDNSWELRNNMTYTYDDLGRVAKRELIYAGYGGANEKYEYIYDGASTLYSTLLFYYGQDENGVWFPAQIANLEYDALGNILSVEKGYWDDGIAGWQYFEKQTATWDELGRQTSFYVYDWDYSSNGWVGRTDSLDNAQEFVYNPDDTDKEIHYFAWENGAWLQFCLEEFTYDSDANLLIDDVKYWNRANADWSGNDRFGQFGVKLSNYHLEYVYDAQGRETGLSIFDTDSQGQTYNSAYFIWTYTPLENGNTEKVERYYNMWDGTQVPVIQWEKLYELNKYGSEAHYKNYTYAHADRPGVKTAIDEEVRYMDEYNNYFGGDFYGFNIDENNSRYGSAKERYDFAEDFDYSSGLNTPVRGYHWNGTSYDTDTEWAPASSYYYEWTHEKYLVSRLAYSIDNDEEIPLYGYQYDRDYDAPYSSIMMWAFSNRSNEAFYEYKTITETTLKGGYDKDWDQQKSYTDYFYYSPIRNGENSISNVKVADATIIAYYDINGRKISEPVKGINIVVYSDGSSKKLIAK